MPELGSILTAIVTPFDDAGNVDEDAFVALHNHVLQNGSDGIVACGSTGEAATLDDDEHLRVVELACSNRQAGTTVIAGTGSNDTRHAVKLTERATELGADAVLSVTPYYNKPNRRGLIAHYEAIAAATDKPILLYNIPGRSVIDIPNELLAELGQIDGIVGVKQANDDNLAPIDGLDLYAGNDDSFARALDVGAKGGILVASHVVGNEMRRMITEPDARAEIDAGLRDLYAALGVTTNPIAIKAALNLLGHNVGGLRLPLIEADEHELSVVRGALERHGLLEPAHT